MVKKEYEALTKYEGKLDTVKRTGYVHLTRSEWNEIHEVYKTVFGTALSKSEQNCPRCVVRAVNKLANEYFLYKEKAEKRKSKKNTEDGNA